MLGAVLYCGTICLVIIIIKSSFLAYVELRYAKV